jgi:hypothetical protein
MILLFIPVTVARELQKIWKQSDPSEALITTKLHENLQAQFD